MQTTIMKHIMNIIFLNNEERETACSGKKRTANSEEIVNKGQVGAENKLHCPQTVSCVVLLAIII